MSIKLRQLIEIKSRMKLDRVNCVDSAFVIFESGNSGESSDSGPPGPQEPSGPPAQTVNQQ